MFLNFLKNRLKSQTAVQTGHKIAQLEAIALAAIVVVDFEDFRPVAYHATEDERRRGIYTVGFGDTQGIGPGDRIDYGVACVNLKNKLLALSERLLEWNPNLFSTFTPAQIAALISLLYNVGEGNFKGGETFQAFLKGDVRGIIRHGFDKDTGFVKQSGKVLRGLVDRREKESTLLALDLDKRN